MSIPKEKKRNPKATKTGKLSSKQREQIAKDKRQANITREAVSFARIVRAHVTNKTLKADIKAQLKALLLAILGKSLVKATDEEKLVAKTRANKEVYKCADDTVNRDTLKTYLSMGHKALGIPVLRPGVVSKRNSKVKKDKTPDADPIEVPVDLTTDKAIDLVTSIMSHFDLDQTISILRHSAARVYGAKKKITVQISKAA